MPDYGHGEKKYGTVLYGSYDPPAAGEQGVVPNAKPDTVYLAKAPTGLWSDMVDDLGQRDTDLANRTTYADEANSSRCAITSPRCLEAQVVMDTTGTPDTGVLLDHSGSEFKVQRGTLDFGASEDSDTVTITTVGGMTKAFARVTGVQFSSGGPAAGTTSGRNNDDLGVTCVLTDTSTITFTRYSTGENEDVRVDWCVWEYTGPVGGSGEFIVRYHDNVTIASGTLFTEQAVSGISVLADCVPFVCGISSNQPAPIWIRACSTAEMVAGDKVRVERLQTSGVAIISVAAVEYTGTDWQIDANISHIFALSGADETEATTDVIDWDTAFVVCGHRTSRNYDDDLGWTVRPGTTTTTVRFRLRAGCTAVPHTAIAHVVRNANMIVEHLDSITGGETDHPSGAASPQSITTTITAVDDLATTALIATTDDDGNTAYPRLFWNYRLTDTDEVTWWRGRHGSTGDWALQVIQFPAGADPTFKLAVKAGPVVSILQGDAEITTLAIPTNGTTDKVSILWSTEANPFTTGAADAQRSEIWVYNHHGNEYAHKAVTHAVATTSDENTFTVGALCGGVDVFSGDFRSARVSEQFHSSTEMKEDWINVTAEPTITGDTRVEALVPSKSSGFADDGQFVHQLSVAAAAVRKMDLRLTGPLVNFCYYDPDWIDQTYTPEAWIKLPPGESVGGKAYPPRIILAQCIWAPVPATHNRIYTRVNIKARAAVGDPEKLEIWCYSMSRRPIIGGLADPNNPPEPLVYYHTSAHVTGDGTTQWLDLGLSRIARGASGGTYLALAFEIHSGAESDTEFKINAWTSDAVRLVTAAGTLPDGLTIGDP